MWQFGGVCVSHGHSSLSCSSHELQHLSRVAKQLSGGEGSFLKARNLSTSPRKTMLNIAVAFLAHRNRSDFCDLRLRCPSRTPEIARFPRQEKAMLHCDLRVRWKVASDLRFRAAISGPKTPSFCGISGDLAPSTRKSLAIAIVRFWCAKVAFLGWCILCCSLRFWQFVHHPLKYHFLGVFLPRPFVAKNPFGKLP